jgi:uncharacterized protein YdiU (UPF0061 family)
VEIDTLKKQQMKNSYLSYLPESAYQQVTAAPVSHPKVFIFNLKLAEFLGISEWLHRPDYLSGNTLHHDSTPIALGYAGHQFGCWVPELGDGRALLLGQVTGLDNQSYDIQLKGSGRTRYSRQGDGKCPLGAAIREYLISEYLHAIGIPTSRILAVIQTDDVVNRYSPEPGGIVVRVARRHIRVGSFQYWAAHEPTFPNIIDGVIADLSPEISKTDTPHQQFFNDICHKQGVLIGKWMNAGFVHGVMNTDNMCLSGETIDFGPCAFIDRDYPGPVFSGIDRYGRYGFMKQYSMGAWNLTQLGLTWRRIISELACRDFIAEGLSHYETAYHATYRPTETIVEIDHPRYYPRNHWVEAAIDEGVHGNHPTENGSILQGLIEVLGSPQTPNALFDQTAKSIPVISNYQTSCGT